MSQDLAPSRKDRKAQRDAERRKHGKKRKHEEVEQAEEAESRPNELQDNFIPFDSGVDGAKDTSKKSKSASKKRKAEDSVNADTVDDLPDTTPPKPKKRKKSKSTATQNGEDGQSAAPAASSGNHRFVCFIGNLPYDTTDASLQAHFKKLAPFTLRHRTDPQTKKSKGFAFLEFENYDRMKTCLKLYHHSMFDPATAVQMDGKIEQDTEGVGEVAGKKGKGKGARKINVELTAGGGGKTAARKEKIKAKNVRLDEQRQRRAEAERLEKVKGGQKKGEGAKKGGVKAEGVDIVGGHQNENTGVHPSRLARIQT